MFLELDTPIWYSKDSMYSAAVKVGVTLDSPPVDLSKENQPILPTQASQDTCKKDLAVELTTTLASWFTTPLTLEQIQKRLKFEFQPFQYQLEPKWVTVRWVAKHFQVQKKGFVVLFQVESFIGANPRIPVSFIEATTPRATTPTEEPPSQPPRQTRNIVIQPNQMPLDVIDMIPYAEHQSSLELRDEHTRDRHRLRQAKLKAAIARLKVEELKERYLRQYGGDYHEDSSESEEDSQDSELSEPDLKK